MNNKQVNISIAILLALDAALIVFHFTLGDNNYWNLDKEHNLPTWYSSVQLGIIGFASLFCFFAESTLKEKLFPPRWCWAFVSLMFFYLSLDEMTVIHEGVYRNELRDLIPADSIWLSLMPWQIIFGPFLALMALILLLLFLTRYTNDKKTILIALSGLSFWVLAVGTEALCKPIFIQLKLYQLEVAIEEGFEIFGATFLLWSILRYAFSGNLGSSKTLGFIEKKKTLLRAIAITASAIVLLVLAVAYFSLNNSAWLYSHNARLLEKRDRNSEAIIAFKKAYDLNPNDLRVLVGLARNSYKLKNFEQAKDWYKKAIEIAPNNASYYHQIGVVHYHANELNQAKQYFEKAIDLRAKYPRALTDLGRTFEKMGKPCDAKNSYNKAIENDAKYKRAKILLEKLVEDPLTCPE